MRIKLLLVAALIGYGAMTAKACDCEAGTDQETNEVASGEWSCAANNVKGAGPFLGTGATEAKARSQALIACRAVSAFPCWIMPDSCFQQE